MQEESFHLVDSRPVTTRKFGPRKWQGNRMTRRERELKEAEEAAQNAQQKKGRQQQQLKKKAQWDKNYWQGRDVPKVTYTASIDVRPEWTMLEQFTLSSLGKLNMSVKDLAEPEDLMKFGSMKLYDKSFDRVTPKSNTALKKYAKPKVPNPTTSQDPILQKMAADGQAKVFATDNIIATLMCAPRATYSWDITVTKKDGCIFLDKRPDSNFDVLTVNETASQSPIEEDKDNINGVEHLGQEATQLNYNFTQQVTETSQKKHKIGEESWIFGSAEARKAHPVGHRYRRWKIDENLSVIVRCQVDAAMQNKGENILVSVKALNEFDSRVTNVDWRLKIENQRGAVLATELKNNNCKLAKWTAAALLGGIDQMKVGFVSRVHPRDSRNHQILGVQFYRPQEFAMQINLATGNMWAILRHIVEVIDKCADGKYLLLKDPNKPLLRLYEMDAAAPVQESFME